MPPTEDRLYERAVAILDEARSRVTRTVNSAMVRAYWLIGREIVEVEQQGEERAGYGEGLMRRVAGRLSTRFGKGFSLANLKRMKQFYLAFPGGSGIEGDAGGKGSTASSLLGVTEPGRKGSTALSLSGSSSLFPPALAWSHYLVLLRVQNEQARAFYEIEAARESWSVRELERQDVVPFRGGLVVRVVPEPVDGDVVPADLTKELRRDHLAEVAHAGLRRPRPTVQGVGGRRVSEVPQLLAVDSGVVVVDEHGFTQCFRDPRA